MLSAHVVVPLGGEHAGEWRRECDTVLRAAGAEVRSDLPPQRRAEEGGQPPPPCVVLVKRGAQLAAAEHGLLRRARQRGLPVASQAWLEQCLLAQHLLPATDHQYQDSAARCAKKRQREAEEPSARKQRPRADKKPAAEPQPPNAPDVVEGSQDCPIVIE